MTESRVSEPLAVGRQLELGGGLAGGDGSPAVELRDSAFESNKVDPIHRWVPWIAGFSAGFVEDTFRHYLPDPERRDVTVLEPFAGVGTTLVEGLLHGYDVVGFEINPWAALASRVKCSAFRLDPDQVHRFAGWFEHEALRRTEGLDAAFARGDDPQAHRPAPRTMPPKGFRSRVPFFSPFIERKVLHCLDIIGEEPDASLRELAGLAFGAIMVSVSNYSYEPSLGSRAGAGKPDILNADVSGTIARRLRAMAEDIEAYREQMQRFRPAPTARVVEASSLDLADEIAPASVDLVVTSPPYLNNYHYIRNTRPHLFWLDFVAASSDLKSIEHANFGTYWQTVRDGPVRELSFRMPSLEATLAEIAAMRPDKGIYGGQGWANYAVMYFNDCYRMALALRHALKPGAAAIYVIGNSIVQGVEIPTDRVFADIGVACGLELEDIHMLRAKRTGNSVVNSSVRNGKPTKATLYETAVVLRRPVHA